jgi:hypothetical protein
MNKTPTGFILYRGPSLLDGSPIVVVATGFARRSTNAKTGDMVQTYILADGVDPITAARTGQDAAVCGDCKHRPANGGACYVTLAHGPLTVHKGISRGIYPAAQDVEAIAALGAGRMVRLGTYGDPAAAPAWVWQALVSRADGRTGYTHQWRNEALPVAHREALQALVMASADSLAEAQEARARGMRYFRIRSADEALQAREFVCPASEEAGKRTSCAACRACSGTQRTGQASPVIVVHGTKAGRFHAQRSTIGNGP